MREEGCDGRLAQASPRCKQGGILFNVLTVHVIFFAEGEDCLFRHLCSRCDHAGRASTGEASTASGATPLSSNTVKTQRFFREQWGLEERAPPENTRLAPDLGHLGSIWPVFLWRFPELNNNLLMLKNYVFLDFRSTKKFSGSDAAPPERRREDHH